MILSKWIWSACLFLMPLIMVNGLIDAVSIPRMTLFLVSNGLIGSLLLFKERKQFLEHCQHFISSPLGIGLGMYLMIGLLSLFKALSWSDGIWEWLKIFSWFETILIASFLLKEKGNSVQFMKISNVAIFFVGLIGLWEFGSIIDQLDQEKILYLVNATFEHKNLLATGLLLSLPFSVLLYRQATEPYWRWFGMVTMAISIALILITQSRAAWLGMGIAGFLALLLLLMNPSKRGIIRQPKYLTWVGGSFVIALGMLWLVSNQTVVANAPIQRIQAIFTYEDTKNEHTETIKERFLLWNNTVEIIKEHPFLGVGLGNWKIHFPKYRIDGLRSEQGQVFFQRPHNDYLWVMSEMGILGGLSYLGILLVVLFFSFSLLRRTDVQESKDYYNLLIVSFGMIAFLVFSLVDFPKERPIHLLWSAFLMAYIWSYYQKYTVLEKKVDNKWIGSLFLYSLPVIAFGGLWFSGQRWQAEWHAKNALTARSQKDYNTVLDELELANHWTYRLDPASTPLSWYQGEALYLQNKLPEALAAFQESNALHPYHLHTLNNLGATYFGLQQLPLSKDYFQQVLTFAPHFPDANMNMGAMAYNEGVGTEALKYIGNCIPGDYQEKRFLQFLAAISKQYADKLQQITELKPLYSFLQKFGNESQWQVRIHQQAHQYQRTFQEQIHLDLLFVATEQQIINKEDRNILTSILNNLSI